VCILFYYYIYADMPIVNLSILILKQSFLHQKRKENIICI